MAGEALLSEAKAELAKLSFIVDPDAMLVELLDLLERGVKHGDTHHFRICLRKCVHILKDPKSAGSILRYFGKVTDHFWADGITHTARAGDYRILYGISQVGIAKIVRCGHRQEIYTSRFA